MENFLKFIKIGWDYLIPLFLLFGNIYSISMFLNYSIENSMNIMGFSKRIRNKCDSGIRANVCLIIVAICLIIKRVLVDFYG